MLLEVQHLKKSFAGNKVLDGIDFSLQSNRTLSILGKSGCGKTTLLKIIAGLIPQDQGHILLDQQTIDDKPAHRRNIVYLFQEALLFPHLNVFENIAFGLKLRNDHPQQITERTNLMIAETGLSGHEGKMPDQLSGGQKQRVAFARALIIQPNVLLLDEPFGSLDSETRTDMQELFKSISGTHQITSLFVTHDLKEAILMGDQIALMKSGKLKLYSDKKQFISDSETGASDEINFWRSIDK